MWIHACSFDGKATTIPELFPLKICLLSAHHDYIKPIKRGSPCSVIAKRRQLLGQFRLRMIILRKLRELGEFFEQHLFNQEELIFCQLKPCGLQNKLPFKFFSVNSESGCRTFRYGVFRAVGDVQSKISRVLPTKQ